LIAAFAATKEEKDRPTAIEVEAVEVEAIDVEVMGVEAIVIAITSKANGASKNSSSK
jgi:hypothetical protein